MNIPAVPLAQTPSLASRFGAVFQYKTFTATFAEREQDGRRIMRMIKMPFLPGPVTALQNRTSPAGLITIANY